MKKILFIVAMLCICFTTKAQYTFKTQDKIFTDELTNGSFTIKGIRAKVVNGSECNLKEKIDKMLFLEFDAINNADSSRVFIGQQNTTSDLIIKKMIRAGYSQETATVKVADIFKKLEYGNRIEKYESAATLASFYNYTLKSIELQE